ncbi:MAG: methyl-accepting chemotaxis protein [Spirochaetia bacterium]|nr:methyl-accepting chemotaxis protein [Spirochaetia bacterium]
MDQKRGRVPLKYKFQFRLIRRAMFPLFALAILSMSIIWYATQGTHEYTMSQLRWMGWCGVVALCLASLIGVGWSLILYSRRLAGPLIHLEKVLAEIAKGDLSARIHLRKDDELQEHATHLNLTFLSLQDRVKRIHQYCRYTQETLEKLVSQDSLSPHEKSQLERIRELIRLIEEAVGDFRV